MSEIPYHPTLHPRYGETMHEPVFYLAHPLSADEKYTYDQNMDHVLKIARIIIDNNIRVIVPWHTLCLCLDDSNPEHRRVGLEIDCFVASRMSGVILTGHKLSSGMRQEAESCRHRGTGIVIDWIGAHDTLLPFKVRKLAEFLGIEAAIENGG